jgi:hypothetical protein
VKGGITTTVLRDAAEAGQEDALARLMKLYAGENDYRVAERSANQFRAQEDE